MPGEKEVRYFFLHFKNGPTVYFIRNSAGEIYCTIFKQSLGTTTISQPAEILELSENSFTLKDKLGNTIFSLEDYNRITEEKEENSVIEKIGIDEDLRKNLIQQNIIIYDENASAIEGLLSDEEKTEMQSKGFSKKRIK